MLQHLSVLSSIINLVAGTAIVIYLFSAFKQTKFESLKTLAWHSIFINLLVSTQLFKRYVTINKIQIDDSSLFSTDMGSTYSVILLILVTAMCYFLILTIFKLKDRSHKIISVLFFSYSALLIIIYVIINLVTISAKVDSFLNFFLDNSLLLFIFIEIFFLISMLFDHKHTISRKIKYSFSVFFLSRYPVYFIPVITQELRWLANFFVILYINLIPLLWVKFFLLRYKPGLASFIENKKPFAEIFSGYELTDREQEIVRLIIDGLSNKEIKDKLFISPNTVKNHLYNIYQKIGVKNRYELIHIFTKIMNNSEHFD